MRLLSAEIISNDSFKVTTSLKIKLCPYCSKLAITVPLVTAAPHITVQELNRLHNKCMLPNIQNLATIYACNLQAMKTFFFQSMVVVSDIYFGTSVFSLWNDRLV